MTSDCVESVAAWLREITKDKLFFTNRQGADEPDDPYGPISVYPFSLPTFREAQKKVPYIIVQPVSGTDIQAPGEDVQSSIMTRLIMAFYNPKDDEQEGARVLQEMIDFLRVKIGRRCVIPDWKRHVPLYSVDLFQGITWDDFHEDTRPYTVGWIEMTWNLQPVKREVPFI